MRLLVRRGKLPYTRSIGQTKPVGLSHAVVVFLEARNNPYYVLQYALVIAYTGLPIVGALTLVPGLTTADNTTRLPT